MSISGDTFASLAIQEADGSEESKTALRGSTKLICFRLGREEFGISIDQALEVIKLIPITPTPHAPEFVMGVINLRSNIYTVLDLGLMLGMPSHADRIDALFKNKPFAQNRFSKVDPAIVILRIDDKIFGILVDFITSMTNLDETSMIKPPSMLEGFIQNLVSEVVRIGDRLIMKLDLEKITEHEMLKAMEEGAF
jgi:purine-binding chemotaxis protein CheW